MTHKLYAMDTSFYNSATTYDFAARCGITKALGFDATYLTLWSDRAWQDVPLLKNVKADHDLDVAAVYVTLDISESEDYGNNARILELVQTLEGCKSIELNINAHRLEKTSDPAGDDWAVAWLEKLLAVAEKRDIQLLLYPHFYSWLERIEDGVRLCERVNHPNLGMVFTAFHWYAIDGKDLKPKLSSAAPYIRAAALSGHTRTPYARQPVTVEPLDSGELDQFFVLSVLKEIGFEGPIGIQGFSVGGDVYKRLERSVKMFRDLEARLDAQPEWAQFRAPRS